jgi:hypothetical protein
LQRLAQQQPLLQRAQRPAPKGRPRDQIEYVIERPDPTPEQTRESLEQLVLGDLDVTPAGQNEMRFPLERVDVPIEKALYLPGVGRTKKEPERHCDIVAMAPSPVRGRDVRRPLGPTAPALRGRLRPATATSDGATRQLVRTPVAQIGLLCSAPRIGVGKAHRRALCLFDLATAHIAYQNGSPCQCRPLDVSHDFAAILRNGADIATTNTH